MKTMYLISNISDDVEEITVIGETEHDFTIETELGVFINAKNGVEGYRIFDTEKEAWQAIAERLREKHNNLTSWANEVLDKLKKIEQRIKSLKP